MTKCSREIGFQNFLYYVYESNELIIKQNTGEYFDTQKPYRH